MLIGSGSENDVSAERVNVHRCVRGLVHLFVLHPSRVLSLFLLLLQFILLWGVVFNPGRPSWPNGSRKIRGADGSPSSSAASRYFLVFADARDGRGGGE